MPTSSPEAPDQGAPTYVGGHFSNGPTWVEDLSVGLGLGVLKPSLAGGTDFAIGGATTGAVLDGEVSAFEAYVTAAHATQATLNGALFTLDIGAIDILNSLSDPATAAGVVTAAANSAATEVKELNSDGARNFLFYEVPELSLTPEVQALGSAAGTLADTLAQTFNSTLLSDLGSVETGAARSRWSRWTPMTSSRRPSLLPRNTVSPTSPSRASSL